MAQLTQNPPEGLQAQVIWCIEWIRQLRGRLGTGGGGGSVALPDMQVVYGTGTGIGASANFTFNNINGALLVFDSTGIYRTFQLLPAHNIYQVGDTDGLNNGTYININDNDYVVNILSNDTTGVNSTMLSLSAHSGKYIIGDVDENNNGTTISIDDLTQLIKVSNVPTYANDAAAIAGSLVTGQLYKTTTLGITSLNIVP